MELPVVEAPVTFHLSLNVTDLNRSVAFYRTFFDRAPAKLHDDYAKFELTDPPVIFSLVPHAPGPGCSLSHIGLRMPDEESLRIYAERLEAAGVCTQPQNDTVCGYAQQNKVRAKDPDGNFWEVYHIEHDVEPAVVRKSLEGKAARVETPAAATGPVLWEHYVTHPFPERVPHDDNSVDEVRLTGTFNAALSVEQRAALVGEAARVLKLGGKVVTHGLMGDRPFPGAQPKLPGLAAMVSRIPLPDEVFTAFGAAGFVGMQMVKFTEKPWFTHDGVEMREVKVIGWRPTPAATDETRTLMYKGPFAQATADGGHVFPRGERVKVKSQVWEQLRLGPGAEQFLFLDVATASECQT
ncbi:MAG TPA: ArsI/CadI family heavy metal resistance metalloenzyme [Gemmataceae bacterium]|nr:ArsI/CadI family heavy metal resistance metalloenzyme [Gemmataceae bacterium]